MFASREATLKFFIFVEYGPNNHKVKSLLEYLGQDSASIILVPVHDSSAGSIEVWLGFLILSECTALNLRKMFNILQRLLEVVNSLYLYTHNCIQWDLSLDERLTVQKACRVHVQVIIKFLNCLSILLSWSARSQYFIKLVVDLNKQFADNAVFTLAKGGAIDEKDTWNGLRLSGQHILFDLRVVKVDHVNQIFNGELGITNHVLLVVVVNHQTKIEKRGCTIGLVGV